MSFTPQRRVPSLTSHNNLFPNQNPMKHLLKMNAKAILSVTAMLASVATSSALDLSLLPSLRNTGEGLAAGATDFNYEGVLGPNGAFVSTVLIDGDGTNPSHPNWVKAPAGSAWITPGISGTNTHPVGDYTYEVSFNLDDANVDASNFGLFGDWSSDNGSTVQLNDGPLIEHAFKGWDSFSSFSFTSGFIQGDNILRFVVNNAAGNGGNPTALLVANLRVVPEPGTVIGSLLGLGMIGYVGFRRRKAVAAN